MKTKQTRRMFSDLFDDDYFDEQERRIRFKLKVYEALSLLPHLTYDSIWQMCFSEDEFFETHKDLYNPNR